MAIELQVREGALAQALIEWVQKRVFTLCLPPGPSVYVDHLDVLDGSARFAEVGDDVECRLSIAICTVAEADLLAHPNAMPTGAFAASGVVEVRIRFGFRDRALVVVDARSAASATGVPAAVLDGVEGLIDAELDALEGSVLFDASPVIEALSAVVDGVPDLRRGGGVLALRFGASGAAVAQLGPGQAWGVFVDSAEMVDLLRRQLDSAAVPAAVNIRWRPDGAAPAIVASADLDIEAIGIEVASVEAEVVATPAFIAPSMLRLAAVWDVRLSGVIWFLEAAVRRHVRGVVRRMFPFADHSAGAQTLLFDFPLPEPPMMLDARPRWAGISSSPAGMTIGGPIIPAPAAPRGLLELSVVRFGRPVWWGRCRVRARSGEGAPPRRFDRSDAGLRVQAGAGFSDAGALCGVRVLAPNGQLATVVDSGLDGIGFDLTVGAAQQITEDVRLIVRTARGVRLIDLGVPIIRADAEGRGLDVQVNYIDDCLRLSGPWLKLALGESLSVEDLRPQPMEDPDWRVSLRAWRGFNAHVVVIDELDAGEELSVRGPGQRVTVVADDEGRAVVPVLVGIAADMHDVTLERSSGRPLRGAVRVRTTEFSWLGDIGPARAADVRDVDGVAYVGRIVEGELLAQVFEPDGYVAFRDVDAREVELNPQPLPPEPPPDAVRIAARAGVDRAESARFVPGHERGAALVVVEDGHGSGAVVSSRSGVVGRFDAPLIGLREDGGFAIAQSGGSVHLFAVHRPEEVEVTPRG